MEGLDTISRILLSTGGVGAGGIFVIMVLDRVKKLLPGNEAEKRTDSHRCLQILNGLHDTSIRDSMILRELGGKLDNLDACIRELSREVRNLNGTIKRNGR